MSGIGSVLVRLLPAAVVVAVLFPTVALFKSCNCSNCVPSSSLPLDVESLVNLPLHESASLLLFSASNKIGCFFQKRFLKSFHQGCLESRFIQGFFLRSTTRSWLVVLPIEVIIIVYVCFLILLNQFKIDY